MIFDLGIIGGGISGLGVAYEASKLGLKVLVLEKQAAICSKFSASANSLRIIHGGFRYFQKLQFSRLIESVKAQDELLRLFPTLIKPLPCLLPLSSSFGMVSPLTLKPASLAYNLISSCIIGRSNGAKFINSKSVDRIAPILNPFSKFGACLWFDAQLSSPEKLTALIASEIERRGGNFQFKEEIQSIERSDAFSKSGNKFQARVWIDTTGAFLLTEKSPICVGFNLIYNGSLDSEYALAVPGPGRFYFISPRENEIAVGTWYLSGGKPPTEDDINKAALEISSSFPKDSRFNQNNLSRIEAGPLLASSGATPKDVRNIKIKGNCIRVNSTKFTTFLPQAREIIKTAEKLLKTN